MSDLKRQVAAYLDHVIEPVDVNDVVSKRVGSSQMQPLDVRPRPRPFPGWALLVGAAAVVFALFVVPLVSGNELGPSNTSPGPSTTMPSSLEVTEGVLAALAAHDVVAMRSLLTDDALFGGDWDVRPENLEQWLEFDRAIGMTYEFGDCLEDSPGLFRCYYEISNDLSRALAVGPFDGGHFVVIVESGKVTALINIQEDEPLYRQAILPFLEWVEERDPTAFRIMDEDFLTPDGLALWERYVDEFVASQTPD